MFNVGGGELLVILLIALIVLGPQRLPDAARQIGKAMGTSAGCRPASRTRSAAPSTRPTIPTGWPLGATPSPRRRRRSRRGPDRASHPVRTEPLVAGPPWSPGTDRRHRPASVGAGAAAAKKSATQKAAPAKQAAPAARSATADERHAGEEGHDEGKRRRSPPTRHRRTHQDLMSTTAVPHGARRRPHVAHGAPHGAPRPDHQDRHRASWSGWSSRSCSTTTIFDFLIEPYEDIANARQLGLGDGDSSSSHRPARGLRRSA